MLPVDNRPLDEIRRRDLMPYQRLIRLDLPAVMMAHVVYPAVDPEPASLSRRWIEEQLRRGLGFQGAVFCDDLSMRGAEKAGDYLGRARVALAAGCDMLPVCNNRPGVEAILDGLVIEAQPLSQWRLAKLHAREGLDWDVLLKGMEWRQALHALERHYQAGEFRLST
jgi:beta-N-acetylhexosaminidase